MRLRWAIVIATGALSALSGCIAIPIPAQQESKPFTEEVTRRIAVGKTSHKEVLATLGNPGSASSDGRLFLYEEQQGKAQVLYADMAGGKGAITAAELRQMYKPYERIKLFEGDFVCGHCSKSGVCHWHVEESGLREAS